MKAKVKAISHVGDYGNRITAGFSQGSGARQFRIAWLLHDRSEDAVGIPQTTRILKNLSVKK